MLSLTIKDLFESFAPFGELAAQKLTNQKLAYNIAKTFKALRSELEIAQEKQIEIFKRYGGKQTGDRWQIEWPADTLPSTKETFQKELNDLNAVPVEVWGTQLKFSELVAAKIELSPAAMASLDGWFLLDDSDATPTAEGN